MRLKNFAIVLLLMLCATAGGYVAIMPPNPLESVSASDNYKAPPITDGYDQRIPRIEVLSDFYNYNIEAVITTGTNGYAHITETIKRGDEYRDRSRESNYRVYLHPAQGWRLGCVVDGTFTDLIPIFPIELGGVSVLPDEIQVMAPSGQILYRAEMSRAIYEIPTNPDQ